MLQSIKNPVAGYEPILARVDVGSDGEATPRILKPVVEIA